MKILNMAVWSTLSLFLFSANIWAAPSLVNYQGRLVDTNGNPITGTYDITFTIHAAAAGASAVWSEVQTVSLDNGIFSVQLGGVNALGASVFSGDSRWLEVKIGANPPLSPRHRLVSAPYAFTVVSVPKSALPTDISLPTQPGEVATKEYVDGTQGIAGAAILKATQAFSGQNSFVNMVTVSSDLFITAGRINVQGNLLTTAGGLLDAGKLANALPSLDAGALTNLDASNLAFGTVPLGRLSGITNAEISAAAAITYSKLNLSGAISNADLAGSIAPSKIDGGGSVTNSEFGYLDGLTGAIQTQLDLKVVKNGDAMGGPLTLSGSTLTVTGTDASTGYSLNLSSGIYMPGGTITAGLFSGDGTGLTGVLASNVAAANVGDGTLNPGVLLNAGSLTNGPVTSSMLPSTVAYTSVSNDFTAAQTISASGGLTLTNGLSAGSAMIGGGLTASSGTFTATGSNQYSIETSSGIKVNNGGIIADGSLDIGGIIITGSANNQITTAEGLLDAAKLNGVVPVTVTFYTDGNCEILTPTAVAQLCYDTSQHVLNVSTIAALGGFAPLH